MMMASNILTARVLKARSNQHTKVDGRGVTTNDFIVPGAVLFVCRCCSNTILTWMHQTTMTRHHNWTARLFVSLAAMLGGSAQAGLLSTNPNYSVFAFGDYSQQNVDVTGRLAVKGNLTVTGFGVGSALSVNGGASLVVGGNLNMGSGQINHGDIRVGGTASVQNIGLPNGTLYYNAVGNPAPPNYLPQQQVAGGGISPTFFSSAESYANSLSDTLATTSANGQVSINLQGKITLTAVTTGLNVFNLTADQFAGASGQGVNINGSQSATIVVNIVGAGSTSLAVSNFSFGLSGGIQNEHIVYNLRGISTLNSTNLSWQGSILAPHTAFVGTYGNVDGDVAIASVTGTTEFHNVPFTGILPNPVPEPTTIAGALLGFGGYVVLRRRRTCA